MKSLTRNTIAFLFCTFGVIVCSGLPRPIVADDRHIVGHVVMEHPLQAAVDAHHIVSSAGVILDIRVPWRRADPPQIFLETKHTQYLTVKTFPSFDKRHPATLHVSIYRVMCLPVYTVLTLSLPINKFYLPQYHFPHHYTSRWPLLCC